MKNMKSSAPISCPVGRTAHLIGDEWILLVLRELFLGPQRFDDLQKRTTAATNILTNRLARMIETGVVAKVPYQERPVRFKYQLTEAGYALFPLLMELMRYGEEWLPCAEPPPFRLRHLECGKLSRMGQVCSECGQPLTVRNVAMESTEPAAAPAAT